VYPGLEGRKLPTELPSSGVAALASLAATSIAGQRVPTLRDLAGLLQYSAGITKALDFPGGRMYFRAAACTGALYHIELYLVCGPLPDLAAGVYHFGAQDFALRPLREGDYRGVLLEAAGGEPAMAQAPAVIVATSVYWRNAWKYQGRAYRHAYWDSGTILSNLLAMGTAYNIPLKVIAAFADGPVNRLLDLDDQREVALQMVPVGRDPADEIGPPLAVDVLNLEVEPYSRSEVDYPAMGEMHAASSLVSPQEVKELWGNPPSPEHTEPQGQGTPWKDWVDYSSPGDGGCGRRFAKSGWSRRDTSVPPICPG